MRSKFSQDREPSKGCELSKKVWSDYKKVIPTGIQCAAFSSSKTSCEKNWSGEFTCTCKLEGVDESLYYSYVCNNNKDLNCNLNIDL